MTDVTVLDLAFSERLLITVEEAARLLGISSKTLRDDLRRGQITYRATGGGNLRPRRRFAREDIEAYMERVKCRSTDQRQPVAAPRARSTNTTSRLMVIDFAELQEQRAEERRKRMKRS